MKKTNRTLIIDGILMIRDYQEPHTGGAKCCWPICPKSIAMKKASRYRPDAADGDPGTSQWPRRNGATGTAGGNGWFVTFADLMGLMMSFFVMLVAFSNQDQQKLKIVAGSMREAFGVQTEARYSGIIESDGVPTRPKLKNTAHIPPEEASNTPDPGRNGAQPHRRRTAEDRSRVRGLRLRRCARRCRICRS